MRLLHEVDKPGSDVEDYITNLDVILLQKMEMIKKIRDQLNNFYGHIKREQELSQMFHKLQANGDENNGGRDIDTLDINDPHLNIPNPPAVEDNLLEEDDMLMDDISDELGAYKIRHN